MPNRKTPVTVAYGDGIGPEIMEAVLGVLEAAGAKLAPEVIEIGERVYRSGNTAGIAPEAWESLRRTKVFLKAPITTPSGGGYKSLNVTVRKTLGLYANVRPCVSYDPFVRTLHPGVDLVIVRENEEDLYAGIEHRQTDEVFQCLKLITRPGCEKIVRYAFEYARAHGRKRVTCMTKDNIMKMTDGLFHKVFDEIGASFPDIAQNHMIIDIGAAKLATKPETFDVIVTPNLYGDIISDIAAELTGSVGLGGSANIGEHVAMFEAIHGSAPDIAGQDKANPSGLLLGAVQMLVHIRQNAVAERVHNAWLRALEDGVRTAELAGAGVGGETGQVVGTRGFARAVIDRLGQEPRTLAAVRYPEASGEVDRPVEASAGGESTLAGAPAFHDPDATIPAALFAASQSARSAVKPKRALRRPPAVKALVGVDVFVHAADVSADYLAGRLQTLAHQPRDAHFALQMITNRGVKVWPGGFPETFCTDHWRCRFMGLGDDGRPGPTSHAAIIGLLHNLQADGLDFIKIENLCTFDGEPGFALGQGQ